MIASIILLNIGLTTRTPLGRLLNNFLGRLLLSFLDTAISPIVILRARLALVPSTIMSNAVDVIAAEAAELGICVAVTVDLTGGAVLGNTPSETGDGFYGGFGAEFVVPPKDIRRSKLLNISIFHRNRTLWTIDLIPDLRGKLRLDPIP
jgi:hypothetical protein